MKKCDLIMKGGITSGVVYPKVITELANEYRFVNLGGTSAGAIGAGFAAAAEFSRAQGNGMAGFEILDSIPEEISPRLASLFEANPEHRKTLKYLMALMKAGTLKKVFSSLWNLLRIIKSFKKLPKTNYGLCSGLSADQNKNLALTDWMNLWLEKTAGRLKDAEELPDSPLNFGMLKANKIKLRTVTTNLSQRTPVYLPDIQVSFVKKSDLEALMPENIVNYVASVQDQIPSNTTIKNPDDYYLLPTDDLMPVLLAIRLSLSFPVLLAAFPIYRVDYSKRLKLCENAHDDPEVCWLSDGGITSNFPINLFDSLMPSRPTFGISLGEYHECRQEADKENYPDNRVYLPMKAGQGQSVEIHEVKGLLGFLMSIFNAAQTWQDTNQTYLAGYRERVVRIALKGDEGGLNLEMPPARIESLTKIGQQAGKTLLQEFDLNEHRWRRTLGAYAAIEKALEELEFEYSQAEQPMSAFLDNLINAYGSDDPLVTSYDPANLEKLTELKSRIDALIKFAPVWTETPLRNNWGAAKTMPKPSSALKITPQRFVG